MSKMVSTGMLFLGLAVPGPLRAQRVIDFGDFRDCGCELSMTEWLRLGTADGEGIVESQEVDVAFNATGDEILMFQIGSHRLKQFDRDGRFVRAFGRKGEGPGDIGWVTSATYTPDGELMVLDYERAAVVHLAGDGTEIDSYRTPMASGRVQYLAPDSVIVVRIDRSPDRAGFPLHVVPLSGGEIESFGSNGEFSTLDPLAGSVLLGSSVSPSTVWWGSLGKMHFEEWDPRRRVVLNRVMGEPQWWAEHLSDGDPEGPPVLTNDFVVDGHGRLWTATRIPDPDWREVEKQGAEGLVMPEQDDDYWNSRLDVYDLETKAHIGSHVLENALTRLALVNGEVLAGRVEYTTAMVPQFVLYRLAPGRN